MSKIDDGGPAFPTLHHDQGMTLRDWFAGNAISGIINSSKYYEPDWAKVLATEAYGVADAMLAAREA